MQSVVSKLSSSLFDVERMFIVIVHQKPVLRTGTVNRFFSTITIAPLLVASSKLQTTVDYRTVLLSQQRVSCFITSFISFFAHDTTITTVRLARNEQR